MTPDQLKRFRISARLLLLERLMLNSVVTLFVRCGASEEEARQLVVDALERDTKEAAEQFAKHFQSDPAQFALYQDEFSEIAADLISYINSLQSKA